MYAGKPIIGIVGGIGSGKSLVARLFGEEGCHVIDSDAQVRQAYEDANVVQKLREWWGNSVTQSDGKVDRAFIAGLVFKDVQERRRLESLVHPWVNAARVLEMDRAIKGGDPVAFVWDTPLLFEAGLAASCDAIVFVDAPMSVRIERVGRGRGWDEKELIRRENSQWALDKKRSLSDYVVSNAADAAQARDQVRELLPRILAQVAQRPATGG